MDTLTQFGLPADYLDTITRQAGLGGVGSSTYSVMNGINNQGSLPILPSNIDNQGITFFTKPCLNLSYHNIINVRRLAFLANTDRTSMGNAIRCMLNPLRFDTTPTHRYGSSNTDPEIHGDAHRSSIIDDLNPFIPLLSNTLTSLTGWPDFSPDTYTSPEGINKEQVSWIDARPDILGTFDLTATFLSMEGDPIQKLFSTWIEYATRVAEGSMIPFPINIIENRIDYQTRIYRFTLDKSRRYIQSVTACGAAFPMSDPRGAKVNFNSDKPLTEESNNITIPFRAMIAMYDDPILLQEFNTTVELANAFMTDTYRESYYRKLNTGDFKSDEKPLFNYKAYPRVNIETSELEWWVPIATYNQIIKPKPIETAQ